MRGPDLPHAAGCLGHHCTVCGLCLGYDPDDDLAGDESPAALRLCEDCRPGCHTCTKPPHCDGSPEQGCEMGTCPAYERKGSS